MIGIEKEYEVENFVVKKDFFIESEYFLFLESV